MYGENQNLKYRNVTGNVVSGNRILIWKWPHLHIVQLSQQKSSLKEGNSPLPCLFTYLAMMVPLEAKECARCWGDCWKKKQKEAFPTNVQPKRGTENQQANNRLEAVKSLTTIVHSASPLHWPAFSVLSVNTPADTLGSWELMDRGSFSYEPRYFCSHQLCCRSSTINRVCFQAYLYFGVVIIFGQCNI